MAQAWGWDGGLSCNRNWEMTYFITLCLLGPLWRGPQHQSWPWHHSQGCLSGWCVTRRQMSPSHILNNGTGSLAWLVTEGSLPYTLVGFIDGDRWWSKDVEIDDVPVGQHPLVSCFLKGVFNSGHLSLKYMTMWDVDIIDLAPHHMEDNNQLSYQLLTHS